MLPLGNIIFALIVAPFKMCFRWNKLFRTKVDFDDTETNKLRVCVHLLLIVKLILKLYFLVSYFGDVCFYCQ